MARKRTWLDYFFGPWVLRFLGVEYPERPTLELVQGEGVDITVEDDPTTDATKVTISASGDATGVGPTIANTGSGTLNNIASTDGTTLAGAIRFANSATVTGIADGADRRRLWLFAAGGALVLANESALSTSTNRIVTGTGKDITIPQGGAVALAYDDTSDRWRVQITIPEGAAVPTGTGFRRVVDGVEEAAAEAVNLEGGSTYVTGVLPVDNGGTGLDVSDLTGQAGKAMVVNEGEDGYTFVEIPEGAAVPTGTGFRRVIDGTEELTAAAVELDGGSTHVTGVLPVDHGGTGLDASDLSGQAGKALVVNVGEDGYTFVEIPAGATVPTGTGFRHVTGGVEDAAAKLVENADVATGANIEVTKLAAGSPNTVLTTNGSGTITWGAVGLSNMTTGVLPINKGGTGVTVLPGSSGNPLINSSGALGAATNWTFDSSGGFVGSSSGFIALGGGTVATTGLVRVPFSAAASMPVIVGRASGGSNTPGVSWGPGNAWWFGYPNANFVARGASADMTFTGNCTISGAGTVSLLRGSTTNFVIDATGVSIRPGGTQRASFTSDGATLTSGTARSISVTNSSGVFLQLDSSFFALGSNNAGMTVNNSPTFFATSRGLSLFSNSEKIGAGSSNAIFLPAGSVSGGNPVGGIYIWFEGELLKAMLPNGQIKTFTWS